MSGSFKNRIFLYHYESQRVTGLIWGIQEKKNVVTN